MSAVVIKMYDVGYDTRKTKKKSTWFTVRLLATIKEIKTPSDINRQKISSFREAR